MVKTITRTCSYIEVRKGHYVLDGLTDNAECQRPNVPTAWVVAAMIQDEEGNFTDYRYTNGKRAKFSYKTRRWHISQWCKDKRHLRLMKDLMRGKESVAGACHFLGSLMGRDLPLSGRAA